MTLDISLQNNPSQVRRFSSLLSGSNTSGIDRLADGKRDRPYETVLPLAEELGLTVDTSCSKKDTKCVKDLVKDYTGSGNILICWEHKELTKIAEKLGDDDAPTYPDDR